MIILDLLFLFDSLSDIKRPFYQAEHPIAIGNEKKFRKKKHAITIYGNCVFFPCVFKNKKRYSI